MADMHGVEAMQAAQEQVEELQKQLALTRTEMVAAQEQADAQEAWILEASTKAKEVQTQLGEVSAQVVLVLYAPARSQV